MIIRGRNNRKGNRYRQRLLNYARVINYFHLFKIQGLALFFSPCHSIEMYLPLFLLAFSLLTSCINAQLVFSRMNIYHIYTFFRVIKGIVFCGMCEIKSCCVRLIILFLYLTWGIFIMQDQYKVEACSCMNQVYFHIMKCFIR